MVTRFRHSFLAALSLLFLQVPVGSTLLVCHSRAPGHTTVDAGLSGRSGSLEAVRGSVAGDADVPVAMPAGSGCAGSQKGECAGPMSCSVLVCLAVDCPRPSFARYRSAPGIAHALPPTLIDSSPELPPPRSVSL
jgi:hypothetical protein